MTIYRNSVDGTASLYYPGGPALTVDIVRNGVTLASGLSTVEDEGTYTVIVPFAVTEYDADLVLNWKSGPTTVLRTTREEVVTPILPLHYIANIAAKYGKQMTTDELGRVESLIRNVIESYTGQFFGLYLGTREVKASGDPYLALPMPLVEWSALTHNGASILNEYSGIRTTPDGWYLVRPKGYLEIKEAPPEEYVTYGVIYAPPVNGLGFMGGSYYAVTGKWGYYNTPEPVLRAAELLVDDYLCPEVAYLDNYASAVTAADFRADYHEFRFSGTGNARVDTLLKPYINISMVVV